MLLYKDDGRIYCENFSFELPHEVVLGVDQTGNDVEIHDPKDRWIIKFIQNFPIDKDEPLFQSHYEFYGNKTPPDHPVPFTTPGGVSGESLLHDDDPRRYIWSDRPYVHGCLLDQPRSNEDRYLVGGIQENTGHAKDPGQPTDGIAGKLPPVMTVLQQSTNKYKELHLWIN